ncbi:phosphotransferase system [Alcanivorax hongdengensis A-11-3]|uniref:Phosphotransferase system n=1 Tax=Alcanivorax hongdengensis A-11-3 TaxID=1177179 RepID=L0WBM1_9GAMM|nr:HPr family phosphocarrier protein [Alcanivorax hongdengensis]EKF74173.1 phosphotransferase system [Alcanivorax hongdengensis A-11-3]
MIETRLDVINKQGLHARAAAKVVSVASRYNSSIQVQHNGQTIDAKSIMGLLMIGAAKGSSVTFRVEGADEEQAVAELTDLFARRFDEGE